MWQKRRFIYDNKIFRYPDYQHNFCKFYKPLYLRVLKILWSLWKVALLLSALYLWQIIISLLNLMLKFVPTLLTIHEFPKKSSFTLRFLFFYCSKYKYGYEWYKNLLKNAILNSHKLSKFKLRLYFLKVCRSYLLNVFYIFNNIVWNI